MALPVTDREMYRRSPLAEVALQLRFPPILRIDAESPSQFQDGIRAVYPLYRRGTPTSHIPPEVPAQLRNLIQGMGAGPGAIHHMFESEDRKWSVTLSRENIVLKTTAYTRWEEFSRRANVLREKLVELYQPTSYTRIGLRYVDIIRRSILQLSDVKWSDLLRPQIAGELASEEFGENITSMNGQLHCKLNEDNCFLTLKTGIALADSGTAGSEKEKCFLIDSDFHTHRPTELNNVTNVLDNFNRISGNLFRWAILHRLRQALEPQHLA